MTRRDLRWKGAGLALLALSCTMAAALEGSPLALAFFPVALLALPLLLHGKRVGQMVRAGWRGHGRTVDILHAARLRRRR
ncbi:hypothetical protein [Sphingomonas hankookensis]|uniref:Uncharacterized protein n=1 Tax=Sphingomonas hankookensis TaxID=563996 RepID=A0ABR5YAN7_9SPHN|nr:hypothetical protein [Sphingomonas hankookensis]KZE12039.1 hypothetical protein AVT10_16650 [Sphingomonas hankookensis]